MSFIKRITLVPAEGAPAGTAETLTIFRQKSKRRKSPRWARPLEKFARRAMKARKVYSEETLRRHNRSARKRKLGWLKDIPLNVMHAQRKAVKEIRK